MSGNAEDEAKARLEVAQLYEGMPGQATKAARYYFAAAEIYRTAGATARARELYQKVIQLEPGNAQANAILQTMLGGAAAAPAPAAAAPAASAAPRAHASNASAQIQGQVAPQPSAGPTGKVTIPTPWISREPRYVAAARGQLTTPPDTKDFRWDPLPPVDPAKVAARAEARKLQAKEVERKSATRIESAFGAAASPFSGGGGGGGGQGRFGGGGPAKPVAPKPAAPAAPAANAAPAGRFAAQQPTDIRGGNRDLADSIRKKLQGG